MSIILALALQLATAPHTSADDTFAARVTRGKLVEAGVTGPAYQKALWAQITDPTTTALKGCLASNAPADKSPFTLVADVQPDGHPTRVAAEPATPVANCLAGWLASLILPAPPKLTDGNVYPIEIDVSITR
ncbi:MAG TPA: peptidase C13 [Rhodanobacter sp.]